MSDYSVPMFPLPDLVLFPQVDLPLHIFEPRYREMIRDVMQTTPRRLVMATARSVEEAASERPSVYDIGTMTEALRIIEAPDGRFLIVVRGMFRVQFESFDDSRSYRIAKCVSLEDDEPTPSIASYQEGIATLGMLTSLIQEQLRPVAPPDPGVTGASAEAGLALHPLRQLRVSPAMPYDQAVNTLAYRLPLPTQERVRMLRQPFTMRARRLEEHLTTIVRARFN